jgi:tripartite ATP-independent transporter DctP family solute receptor
MTRKTPLQLVALLAALLLLATACGGDGASESPTEAADGSPPQDSEQSEPAGESSEEDAEPEGEPDAEPDAEQQPVQASFAHVLPEGHHFHEAATRIAERMASETGGEVQIEVFPAGQLGDESALNEALLSGGIELVLTGLVGNWYPPANVLLGPGLWRDVEHIESVVRGDVGEEELWRPIREEHGVHIPDAWYYGAIQLTANRPTPTVADMAGLKIRVTTSDYFIDAVDVLGMDPTPMAFSELYFALQTGTVDSQINPLPTIYSANLYEVQDYLMPTELFKVLMTVTVSDEFMQRLTPGNQELLTRIIREEGSTANRTTVSVEEEMLTLLAEEMEIVEPDREEIQAVYEEQLVPKYEEQWGDGLYFRLRDAD